MIDAQTRWWVVVLPDRGVVSDLRWSSEGGLVASTDTDEQEACRFDEPVARTVAEAIGGTAELRNRVRTMFLIWYGMGERCEAEVPTSGTDENLRIDPEGEGRIRCLLIKGHEQHGRCHGASFSLGHHRQAWIGWNESTLERLRQERDVRSVPG